MPFQLGFSYSEEKWFCTNWQLGNQSHVGTVFLTVEMPAG
jgi:hypothetical protein